MNNPYRSPLAGLCLWLSCRVFVQVTDEDVDILVAGLPSLVFLNLNGCRGVCATADFPATEPLTLDIWPVRSFANEGTMPLYRLQVTQAAVDRAKQHVEHISARIG